MAQLSFPRRSPRQSWPASYRQVPALVPSVGGERPELPFEQRPWAEQFHFKGAVSKQAARWKTLARPVSSLKKKERKKRQHILTNMKSRLGNSTVFQGPPPFPCQSASHVTSALGWATGPGGVPNSAGELRLCILLPAFLPSSAQRALWLLRPLMPLKCLGQCLAHSKHLMGPSVI